MSVATPSELVRKEPRPRFSWPMRFFLGFLLFDAIYSSCAALIPYRDWAEDLGMQPYPLALPDPEERGRLARESADADRDLVAERVMRSFDSVWIYFMPWPEAESRRKMDGAEDAGKFVLSWTASRLRFLEHLVFAPQRWTMFSPNVGKGDPVIRARLIFEDGSREVHRNWTEPNDVLHHDTPRFLTEKWLQATFKMREEARLGYCNYMAHRRPSKDGSPLVKIELLELRYDYPPPDEDPKKFLERQKVALGEETVPPYYEYDVASRKGRKLP